MKVAFAFAVAIAFAVSVVGVGGAGDVDEAGVVAVVAVAAEVAVGGTGNVDGVGGVIDIDTAVGSVVVVVVDEGTVGVGVVVEGGAVVDGVVAVVVGKMRRRAGGVGTERPKLTDAGHVSGGKVGITGGRGAGSDGEADSVVGAIVAAVSIVGVAVAAAAAVRATCGWRDTREDGRGVGEVERVCRMLRGKSALCCIGIFRVGKTGWRKLDGGRMWCINRAGDLRKIEGKVGVDV